MTSIRDLLTQARGMGVARLDAMALLSHHTQATRAWLVAHEDDAPAVDAAARVRVDLSRRAAGEPLAYLVGRREFHGLDLEVTPDVLVPRPDTEVLVDWAIETLRRRGGDRDDASIAPSVLAKPAALTEPPAIVVDLGTGSGAIALAIKHACTHARVHAVDTSGVALDVARRNAQRLDLLIDLHQGDWWHSTGLRALRGLVTLAVTNPPYVRVGDPHLAALAYEPALALVSGDDGLDAIRVIVRDARNHLSPGGSLLIEHGFDQGEAVRALLHQHGFGAVSTRRDLAGHERCTGGTHDPRQGRAAGVAPHSAP